MLSAPALTLVDGALDRDARSRAAAPGSSPLRLPAAITGPLLTRVPAAFHGGINDVLLTGWCWRLRTGAPGMGVATPALRC